jgi:hypothetical protein
MRSTGAAIIITDIGAVMTNSSDDDCVVANSRQELKEAIKSKTPLILIEDAKSARSVRIVKAASKASLAGAIASLTGGVVVALALIAVPPLLISAVAFLLFVLGFSIPWSLYKDYDIDVGGEINVPTGPGGRGPRGSVRVILKRKGSSN